MSQSSINYLIKSFNATETIKTRITAPMIEGMIAIPATTGPQDPSKYSPRADPINPATIFAIQLIEPPRLVSHPAIEPMIAPINKLQIRCNIMCTS